MWPSISFLLCCILRVSYSWACTTYIPIIDQISYHLHLHLMMSPGYCYCREQSFLAVLDHVVYFQGKSRLRVVGLKYVGSCPPETTRLLFCAPRSKCHFHRERTCFLAKWFIWVQQPFYHLLSQNTVTVFLNITHGGIFCSPWNRKWGAVNEFMIMMIFA